MAEVASGTSHLRYIPCTCRRIIDDVQVQYVKCIYFLKTKLGFCQKMKKANVQPSWPNNSSSCQFIQCKRITCMAKQKVCNNVCLLHCMSITVSNVCLSHCK